MSVLGVCGPFTDVSDAVFCPFVLEIFTLGITTGTTATTYSPGDNVTRLQMAAFLSRSVDGVLKRGSKRAALDQFWTPQNPFGLGLIPLAGSPTLVKSDGGDLWVPIGGGSVSRVRGTDGKVLETWTGAGGALGVLAAAGRIFVTGHLVPGRLYEINPSQPAGAVATISSSLGDNPLGIAFDGSRIWTANGGGSVSIVGIFLTTVTAGFNSPIGILFDGTNIWVTDVGAGTLLKLDAAGAILQTVTVGDLPRYPVFDGTNIWVPNGTSNSVSVVRASTGAVLATLTGNGLTQPFATAFDGARVLVTNRSGDSVSLFKAADLTPLGSFGTGTGSNPYGACSDGTHFWVALSANQLAKF
jgi:YVTN family beta-propeller protein